MWKTWKNFLMALAVIGNLLGSLATQVAAPTVMTATAANAVVAVATQADACETDTACDAARIQANMPDYVGEQAPTTQTMVCVHVLAYEPTELVLAAGDQPVGQPVTGDVLTSWRVQEGAWQQWGNTTHVYREICFPRALLFQGNNPNVGFRDLTLCNGEYLNEPLRNRSVWRASKGVPQYIESVRRVEVDDPACLLGDAECARYGL